MKCNNCNKTFETPRTRKTTYESYYGVAGELSSRTPITIEVCPHCESEEIAEENEDEDEDED